MAAGLIRLCDQLDFVVIRFVRDEEGMDFLADKRRGGRLPGDDFDNVVAVEVPGFTQELLFSVVVVLVAVDENRRAQYPVGYRGRTCVIVQPVNALAQFLTSSSV